MAHAIYVRKVASTVVERVLAQDSPGVGWTVAVGAEATVALPLADADSMPGFAYPETSVPPPVGNDNDDSAAMQALFNSGKPMFIGAPPGPDGTNWRFDTPVTWPETSLLSDEGPATFEPGKDGWVFMLPQHAAQIMASKTAALQGRVYFNGTTGVNGPRYTPGSGGDGFVGNPTIDETAATGYYRIICTDAATQAFDLVNDVTHEAVDAGFFGGDLVGMGMTIPTTAGPTPFGLGDGVSFYAGKTPNLRLDGLTTGNNFVNFGIQQNWGVEGINNRLIQLRGTRYVPGQTIIASFRGEVHHHLAAVWALNLGCNVMVAGGTGYGALIGAGCSVPGGTAHGVRITTVGNLAPSNGIGLQIGAQKNARWDLALQVSHTPTYGLFTAGNMDLETGFAITGFYSLYFMNSPLLRIGAATPNGWDVKGYITQGIGKWTLGLLGDSYSGAAAAVDAYPHIKGLGAGGPALETGRGRVALRVADSALGGAGKAMIGVFSQEATPVVQPASADQAAIADPATATTQQVAVLVNAIRTALVSLGWIKGSA